MHKLLVNRLLKPAQEKADRPAMTIAVDVGRKANKQTNLASAPPPKSTKGARNQAFKLKSRLICFISIAALPACKISAKYINNCLSYCEI